MNGLWIRTALLCLGSADSRVIGYLTSLLTWWMHPTVVVGRLVYDCVFLADLA